MNVNNDLKQEQIQRKLKQFDTKHENFLKNSPEKVGQWFIKQILSVQVLFPRIFLLKQSLQTMKKYLPSLKYINTVFLEIQNVCNAIQHSNHIIDMAFINSQHFQIKKQTYKKYDSSILQTLFKKIEFMNKKDIDLNQQLSTNLIRNFMQYKKQHPKQIYAKITHVEQLQQQVILIFNYVIKPLQEFKPQSQVITGSFKSIVLWLLIIDDKTDIKSKLLFHLSCYLIKRIIPSRSYSIRSYETIYIILDALSISYHREDSCSFQGLVVILNKMDKIGNMQHYLSKWIENQRKQLMPQIYENLFRNAFKSSSIIYAFNLVLQISRILKEKKKYEILYHLFNSFIRKDYTNVRVPNWSFLNKYLETIELYAYGFINRDRFQGETQLNTLTQNFQSILLSSQKIYQDRCLERIIFFYRVYENRFYCLNINSKRFLRDLERFYPNYQANAGQIEMKLGNMIFREATLNDEVQIMELKRTDRYRGLMNLGNTCYMNSYMQCLFMTSKFKYLIMEISDKNILSSKNTILYALINLFIELSTKMFSQMQNQFQPHLFKSQTPQPFKTSWEQHDAAQFGRMYLDSIINSLQSENELKEKIEKIFFQKIKKNIVCLDCKLEREINEKIFDLILSLQQSDDNVLASKLLSRYFQGEKLMKDNKLYCEKCKKKTQTSSTPQPCSFSEYLVMTVTIFKYEQGKGTKIMKTFDFQFSINFKTILPEKYVDDMIYELYAFVMHMGNFSERGHYTCYARSLDQNPMLWYIFDDSYVTERIINQAEDIQIGQTQNPYILFYRRRPNTTL